MSSFASKFVALLLLYATLATYATDPKQDPDRRQDARRKFLRDPQVKRYLADPHHTSREIGRLERGLPADLSPGFNGLPPKRDTGFRHVRHTAVDEDRMAHRVHQSIDKFRREAKRERGMKKHRRKWVTANKKQKHAQRQKHALLEPPTPTLSKEVSMKADREMFPGGGRQRTSDIVELSRQMTPMLQQIEKGKKGDEDFNKLMNRSREYIQTKNRCSAKCPKGSKCFPACARKVAALLVGLEQGNHKHSDFLLQLQHQVNQGKAQLLQCKANLQSCSKTNFLGETASTLKPSIRRVKGTAVEMDKRSNGEHVALTGDNVRYYKHEPKYVKSTGVEDDKKRRKQVGVAPADKMTSTKVRRLVEPIDHLLKMAEAQDQQENRFLNTQISKNAKIAAKNEAAATVAKSEYRKKLLLAIKTKSERELLSDISHTNRDVLQCMKELQACPDKKGGRKTEAEP